MSIDNLRTVLITACARLQPWLIGAFGLLLVNKCAADTVYLASMTPVSATADYSSGDARFLGKRVGNSITMYAGSNKRNNCDIKYTVAGKPLRFLATVGI